MKSIVATSIFLIASHCISSLIKILGDEDIALLSDDYHGIFRAGQNLSSATNEKHDRLVSEHTKQHRSKAGQAESYYLSPTGVITNENYTVQIKVLISPSIIV